MLPRSERISTKLFKEVIQKGAIHHSDFLILRSQKTLSLSRFGISVPKKVAKTAVLRNKIKRRLYLIIKSLKPRISIPTNTIIIVKSGLEKANLKQTHEEVVKIFVKSGILK